MNESDPLERKVFYVRSEPVWRPITLPADHDWLSRNAWPVVEPEPPRSTAGERAAKRKARERAQKKATKKHKRSSK